VFVLALVLHYLILPCLMHIIQIAIRSAVPTKLMFYRTLDKFHFLLLQSLLLYYTLHHACFWDITILKLVWEFQAVICFTY
jgi:hypothetical protein